MTRVLLAALLVLGGGAATLAGLWLAFGPPGVLLVAGPAAVAAGLLFVDVDGGGSGAESPQ